MKAEQARCTITLWAWNSSSLQGKLFAWQQKQGSSAILCEQGKHA